MSKIAFQSQEDGTGTFTIAAPVGDTNRTLTIPDSSGTLITTAGAAMSGPLSNFTSTGIVDNATATSLAIDSDGRVLMPNQPSWSLQPNFTTGSNRGNPHIIPFYTTPNNGAFANQVIVNTSGRVTVPIAGKYYVSACWRQENVQTDYQLSIFLNGAGVIRTGVWNTSQAYETVHIDRVLNLNANDYIEVLLAGTGSTNSYTGYSDTLTWFNGFLIG